MKIKKFVIAGASTYGVKNHGDDAMLGNLIQGLKLKYPKCEITLIARHPNKKVDKLFKIKSIKNFDHDKKPKIKNRLFYGFNKDDKSDHLNKIVKEISKSNLVILGGNLFMEIFKNNFLRGISSYSTLIAIISKLYSKPVSLYGVNIVSKLKEPQTIEHAKFILENSKKITVREKSAKKLLNAIKSRSKNIAVFGDPAFGINFSKRKRDAFKTLVKSKIIIPEKKKIIGICIREEYWKINRAKQTKKIKKIAQILNNLQKKIDCIFLFIPNCTYNDKTKWSDDRVIHRVIKKYLNKKRYAFTINREINLFETINLFSILDLHITNRRHSMVFAALNSIPSIIIKDQSGDMPNHQTSVAEAIGLKNNAINLNDSLNKLNSKVISCWNDKKNIKKILNKKTKTLIKKSKKQVNYITQGI